MKSNQRKSLAIGLCIVTIIIAAWWMQSPNKPGQEIPSPTDPIVITTREATPVVPLRVTGGKVDSSNLHDALVRLKNQLANGTPAANQELLVQFFETRLRSQASPETIEQLIRFLDSGQDSSTGLRFSVGPGHAIREWPTLRVAALDWLGLLAPAEAALYAETIFAQQNSADEYAVALRNFSLGKPEDKATLAERFVTLLENESWKASPTTGYLEAFDVAVHLADPRLVQPLASHLANGSSAPLRQASFIALDRMTQANQTVVLAEVVKDPSLAKTPRLRAGLVGRADIRNPEQRSLLESYLLDPAVTAEEISYFLEAFPNGSGVMLHGLLSENRTVSFVDLAQQDLHALQQIQQWQREARFESRLAALKQLETRLAEYVASAVRGGVLTQTP